MSQKLLAYVGSKDAEGKYYPFVFGETLLPANVEFSDGMYLIAGEEAKKQVEEPKLVREITYPATARGAVKRVYTDLAVLAVADGAFIVHDMAPGVTLEELQKRTDAPVKAN